MARSTAAAAQRLGLSSFRSRLQSSGVCLWMHGLLQEWLLFSPTLASLLLLLGLIVLAALRLHPHFHEPPLQPLISTKRPTRTDHGATVIMVVGGRVGVSVVLTCIWREVCDPLRTLHHRGPQWPAWMYAASLCCAIASAVGESGDALVVLARCRHLSVRSVGRQCSTNAVGVWSCCR